MLYFPLTLYTSIDYCAVAGRSPCYWNIVFHKWVDLPHLGKEGLSCQSGCQYVGLGCFFLQG